ncbi:HAMP domain-containing histidine kinase [Reichenbachiella agarivorans]|uniref:histidine kinase n=1 Tax=Reichenbachiella agarivorans TaxID=2979464 RepID=A0ABY6CLZ9_9BACT|nr:HAMP domain-containing sensor histidine kinase [Reichenbachiella agarivorans]UXP31552.1 HAMP domain-containing histidine kinase [Reichenbachiella agarivorans]
MTSLCLDKEVEDRYAQLALLPSDSNKVLAILDLLENHHKLDNDLELANQAYYISQSIDYKIGLAKSSYRIGLILFDLLDYPTSAKNFLMAFKLANEVSDTKLMTDALLAYAKSLDEQDQIDSAFWYYERVLSLSDSIDYQYARAETNYYIAGLANAIGQNERALTHLLDAENYYNTIGIDSDSWHIQNLLAIIYEESAHQSKAFEYYYIALEKAEISEDEEAMLMVSNNLAILYELIGDNKKAKEFYWSAIEQAHVLGYEAEEAYMLSNVSGIHLAESDTALAQSCLTKSMYINRQLGEKCDMAYPYQGMGDLHSLKMNTDSALWYYNQALNLCEECQNLPLLSSVYRHLGQLYIGASIFSKGVEYLRKSLAMGVKVKLLDEQKETNFALYNAYKKMGNMTLALVAYEDFQKAKDLLLSQTEANEIIKITSDYEFKKKMQDLDYKKKADFLKLQAMVHKHSEDKKGLYAFLALILVLVVALSWSYVLVQRQNKKLKVINEEKNTLMGMVAHDLRSPLNNVKSIMSMVNLDYAGADGEENRDQMDYAQMLDESVDNMREMIDRVMDISAIEDMKVNLNLSKCDLSKLVSKVASSYQYIASKKGIKIIKDFDENGYYATVDAKYAHQVFDNLMSNALKFSDFGSTIYLRLALTKTHVISSFADEGPGISIEDQQKLFTRYQKLSARPTGNEDSTGLGLSIVKKFVDSMGGKVRCESELGKGSTFIVEFKKSS